MARGLTKKKMSAKSAKAPAPVKDLYNTEDAAVYLNVTRGHVRKLVSLDVLVPEETGGRDLIFKRKTLDAYIKKRQPRGRPIGSVTSKSRSTKERKYIREYMRKWRLKNKKKTAGGKKAGAKKAAAKRTGARVKNK